MKKYHWLILGIFAVFTGCIPSLYPLYTEDTLFFDPRLTGVWREAEGEKKGASGEMVFPVWSFERRDEKDLDYRLLHTSAEGKASEYEVHLVRLGDHLYFDFYPNGDHASLQNLDDFLQIHLFPVHTFARVEISDQQVVFHMFDTEWLENLIEQRKIRIRHEEIDGMLLLSASTEELQKFIEKYGDDPKAYVDPIILLRNAR